MPIYQTTSFVFGDTEHAAHLFALNKFGNIYTRISNPTTAAFEERLASPEGGVGGLATASGQPATRRPDAAAAGDEMVSSSTLYGGTYNQFALTFKRFGIQVHFVDAADRKIFAGPSRRKPNSSMGRPSAIPRLTYSTSRLLPTLHTSTSSHSLSITPLPRPYLCRPFEHGADIIVHSATKFIGGHGTCIGGIIVDGGTFHWDNGTFPEMVEPSPGYHGMRYRETFGPPYHESACGNDARPRCLSQPFNVLVLQGLDAVLAYGAPCRTPWPSPVMAARAPLCVLGEHRLAQYPL